MSQGEHESELAVDSALEPELHRLLLGEAARLSGETSVDRAAARAAVKRFRGGEQRRRVGMAAAAVGLAAAAAFAFYLGASNRTTQAPSAVVHAPTPSNVSRFALQSGTASTVAGRALATGQPLAAEQIVLSAGACIAANSGHLCAHTPSGAVLELPATAAVQIVTLLSGGITAESFTPESGVSVATIHGGMVALTSAVFALDIPVTPASAEPPVAPSLAPAATVRLATPSHAPSAPPPSASSAGELLELARQERAQRHYSAAALAYRRLEQTFPGSAEARAALVSLGQLQLGQLGQPEAALRSFQAYLAAPGQLQQEAEHGSILALQKLGRKAEERRAIDAFLARYPKSVQARALKERLKQL